MRKLLGEDIYKRIEPYLTTLCEIRVRISKPIALKLLDRYIFLDCIADKDVIDAIIDRATDGSLYAYEEQMSMGYLEYVKGIRIGVVGESRLYRDRIVVRKVDSLCIRIPKEVIGCAAPFCKNSFCNTLLISPPAGGKTTLLRDFARLLSSRYDVLIIDERYEICGADLTMKMGERADVVQGAPKNRIYETAVRTMAPDIVVCDELFGEEDYDAIKKLISSGIRVLATMHGENEIEERYKKLFQRKIYLSSDPVPGTVVKVEE